jgi:glycosyltransferase involved in cell wall biosynthesis
MIPLKDAGARGEKAPVFTVFTPTYNRAGTLARVFDSLTAQTFADFEWLIVDDGSTDDTAALVQSWQASAPFSIRYLYQQNRGKHIASNVGVREARGELFVFFDSDDWCVPEALERFYFHWDSIPDAKKSEFSTVSALCVDMDGALIGKQFTDAIVVGEGVWQQMQLRSTGDRWGVSRTEVLQRFPFPEILNEKFISEGIVWNRMSRQYGALFVNERLKICEYRADGLSASSVRLRSANPMGMRMYYRELWDLPIPAGHAIKAMINYIRFSFHGKLSIARIIAESPARGMALVMMVFGYIWYQADKRKLNV